MRQRATELPENGERVSVGGHWRTLPVSADFYRRGPHVSFRERCAIHEGGHCVAAITFGVPILSVSLDPPNMHRGRYTAEHAFGLECLTVLCLAGIAAEEMHGSMSS